MAPIGTLWTVPQQVTGKIVRATAAFAGIELALPEHYEHNVDNKKPEFLSKFPFGKIPAFEGADGFKLFESAAIARYVAARAPNSCLLGGSLEDAALVDQWIHLADSEVDVYTSLVRALCNSFIPYNKPAHTIFTERLIRAVNILEAHLSTRTFFVGERITLADIYVAGLIQKAVASSLDAALRAKLPNLIRHLETIVNQPKLKDIFGETTYVEKAIQFVPPAKEKKEKEPKPAAPAAPKAEKKPKKADDDEEEPLVPEEPKVKNPLDDLPKSTFNLEDWKRAYSNKDTRGPGGSLEWFYENFDYEGFSVWRVDFKYNEELTQTFMSSNQIGGFFNRLEASRKYLFGSVGVLGASNDSVISGALILRGQSAEPVVNVAPDWESYEYKQLDVKNNAEDKAFFEAALAWDLEVNGKKWVDGKNVSPDLF
ncbi:elongation factor 1-gamma [Gymnopilus junonius]|uniref:Elongation factor 1-gamma n=1 Tax=Gymnopilus junonius TaxID=109634 RepID=A0A9P5NQ55_GYMJU|nr:elongation factor 1-gamma [Gymnopilus junonius]